MKQKICSSVTTKTFAQIFDPWQRNEPLIQPLNPRTICCHKKAICNAKQDAYIQKIYALYEKLPYTYKQAQWFFKHVNELRLFIESNQIDTFIELLKNSSYFCSSVINDEDEQLPIVKQITKYRHLAHLLASCSKNSAQQTYLTWLAQELFFTCFNSNYSSIFLAIMKKSPYHPLIRFIYSVVWKYISQNHWPSWHSSLLEKLKEEQTLTGKHMVYLAGGTDVYTLLMHGMYNIHVIDPFLPTQHPYYSRGWRFLLGGRTQDCIGDIIQGNYTSPKNFFLERASYNNQGTFSLKDKFNKKHIITKSLTKWNIKDSTTKKVIGSLVFERRPVTSSDLTQQDRIFIVSYNEAYFIASKHRGWGLSLPRKNNLMPIYIKQFDRPITLNALQNMRAADEIDFEFIQLGSCVT